MASLAGYWRFSPKRVFMAASSLDGEYSSAFVTCPDATVAKKIARFVCKGYYNFKTTLSMITLSMISYMMCKPLLQKITYLQEV